MLANTLSGAWEKSSSSNMLAFLQRKTMSNQSYSLFKSGFSVT